MVDVIESVVLGDFMFSARWAHRTLVGICIFIAVAVVVYVGWEGWLGAPIKASIRTLVEPLLSKIPNADVLDRIARVLGAAGTALTAAYGVYKGIYYADHNLPERLRQFLSRADDRLRRDRLPLVQAITEARAGERARPSVFYVFPLTRALKEIGFRDLDAAEKSLKEALRQIEEQINISDRQKLNMQEQKIAAHILRGSIASARAESAAVTGESPDEARHAAEEEFSKALDLRPKDLDALELRGRQRELRGNRNGALEDYDQLTQAAHDANEAFRAARAYRLRGELIERYATAQVGLRDASRCFDAALTAIGTLGSLKAHQSYEKGLLLKAYGRVQIAKKRTWSARNLLQDAHTTLVSLKTPEAIGHAVEVEQMLRSLNPTADRDQGTAVEEKRTWWQRLFG